MDPFTHAALGAAVGYGCCSKRLGLKAAAWGAAAAVLPDVDIFFSIGGDEFDALQTHRGFTHGLIFAPLLGPLWGVLLARHYARGGGARDTRWWIAAITVALWSHPLLDYLTPYGTQLLQPFSDARFARSAMPIIDPAYTLILAVGVLLSWRWAPAPKARYASLTAILLSSTYIAYADHLNEVAEQTAIAQLHAAGIGDVQVSAYPTILQIYYRRIVARTATEDRVGYLNTAAPCPISWGVAPRVPAESLAALRATRPGHVFTWFTMDMAHATIDATSAFTRIRVADLRYGTVTDPTQSIFTLEADFDRQDQLLEATFAPYTRDIARFRLSDVIQTLYAACVL